MKTTVLAAFGALTGIASAQFYNVSSKPFHLVLKSENDTLQGATLFACHEGAAIEGLCLGSKNLTGADVFNFNTSSFSEPTNSSIGDTGILSWTLPTVDLDVPSALTLQSNPSSNVGIPLFYPGDHQYQMVAFDENDLLNIQGYVDDTVSPIDISGGANAYYRWYICNTYWGYNYITLAWVSEGLRNPSSLKD